ncbi:MAG: hypothetical protein ACOH1N_08125 [Lutibacter sp.]
MKKLLTICFLIAITFGAKAQTFEETVDYINEKLKCCSINYVDRDFKTASITVEHNGIIIYKISNGVEGKIDILSLFVAGNIPPISFDEADLVMFRITSNDYKQWRMVSKLEAERVVKAIIHLKSLCKKNTELFD